MERLSSKLRHVSSRIKAYRNWYTLVWPLTRILPRSRVISTRAGVRIKVRSIFGEDFVVVHEMFLRDDYQLRTITLAPGPTTIIDAGANIGAFSLFAAKLFPEATILALEPADENFELLKENIALNHFEKQIIPLKVGINDVRGTQTFYISKEQYAHSLVADIVGDMVAEKMSIECVTLDDLVKEQHIDRIGVLKLDIEGTEYELLHSISNLFPRIDNIVLEVHDREGFSPQALLSFMSQHGFTVHRAPTHERVYLLKGPGRA
jgi:FkbM family methyltransferase